MRTKAKEVRSVLDLHNKSSDGLDIILTILQHLVPRLGHNALEHDPATLVIGLKASSRGSCKSFHSKAQEIEDILNCLREDYGPHKLILRYLEQLHSTSNYRHAVSIILISLRRHLRTCGDTKNNLYLHDSKLLTIGIIREELIEHRLSDTFLVDPSSSLICRETRMSEDSNATAAPAEPILPASYQASTINNRKFTLRQRCLVCTLRHYGSDDPDKCPCRGDAFRPE